MDNLLTIAVTNPFDVVRQDDLRIATGCELRVALALEPQIRAAQEKLYRSGESDLADLLEEQDDHDITVKEQKDEEVTDLGARRPTARTPRSSSS